MIWIVNLSHPLTTPTTITHKAEPHQITPNATLQNHPQFSLGREKDPAARYIHRYECHTSHRIGDHTWLLPRLPHPCQGMSAYLTGPKGVWWTASLRRLITPISIYVTVWDRKTCFFIKRSATNLRPSFLLYATAPNVLELEGKKTKSA